MSAGSQRVDDHVALRQRVGRGHPVGAAVRVDRRTADHGQHPVAVAHRIHQTLEHHHPAALAADEPVGVGVEGVALAAAGTSVPRPRARSGFPGAAVTFTPPARAMSLSRCRRLWQARCTATSDDEQAVSTATAGPRRPSR